MNPHPTPYRTRSHFAIRLGAGVIALTLFTLLGFKLQAMIQPESSAPEPSAGMISEAAQQQIDSMMQEKSKRTPTQKKIDSENTPTACCGVAESQTWDSKGSVAPFGQGRGQYPDREAIFLFSAYLRGKDGAQ